MKLTRFSDVSITATSSYLPSRVVTTEELFAGEAVDTAMLERLTGIRTRHFASDEQATSDLAIRAARSIVAEHGTIDRVVLATVSPDHPSPASAPLVQHGLGLSTCPAIDVSAACSGYVFALDLAARAALTGDDGVLVVAAELRSRALRDAAPGVRCLFGDGAAAARVARGPGRLALHATLLGADGSGHAAVRVEAGGTRRPTSAETVAQKMHTLKMQDGPAVFFAAVEAFETLAHDLVKGLGITLDDIDVIVPHQPNVRILDRVARRLGLSLDRFVVTVDTMGNVGGASAGIALDHAIRSGRIRRGTKVMLLTAGAGLTYGAALLEA